MNEDTKDFTARIKNLEDRITRFQGRGDTRTGVSEVSSELLAELVNSLEELHVAEEELRVQNEELVEAQQALEVQRRRYRDLYDFAPDAYIVTDPKGVIREANAAAVKLFSLSPKLLQGKGLIEFFNGDGQMAFYQTLETLNQTGQVQNWETMLRPRVREAFPASIAAAAVRDDQGRPLELRWLIRDISQRRRNEAELASYRDHLEDLIKERTSELASANENLRQEVAAHKQARDDLQKARDELETRVRERTAELERSNSELEQFAYVASHDLQEPLRMVASYVGLLAADYRDKLDANAHEYIAYAVEGAKRMSSLIKALLEFSRVNRNDAAVLAVDANRALDRAIDNLAFTIEEAGATVTHDPLPAVLTDETQLVQVFQNLIDNAVKFRSPDRPPEVRISAEARNDQIVFAVRDNGVGIEPQYFDKVFVIFQRLNKRRDYPGTGIGLAIVKRIVERHGGNVWVQSDFGRGSTFYFSLPAAGK